MLRLCCGSVALACFLRDQVYFAGFSHVPESCCCFFLNAAKNQFAVVLHLILRYFSLKSSSSDTVMTSLYSPLPCQLDDDALQISRPYYSQPAISNYYTMRREELTRLAK